MVCSKLHIICGNCGQDLTKDEMATWEYISKEEFEIADVFITCKNCNTLHSLNKYINEVTDNE